MTTEDNEPVVVAAVEGGGTSFVVAVAQCHSGSSTSPTILFRCEIDSGSGNPQKTLEECVKFFEEHKPSRGYHSLGVASFGPVGLDKTRPGTYGRILSGSPKKPWRNVDLLTPLAKACRGDRPLAVQIETDVNAPAVAEYLLAQDSLSSVAYITVGTGVGVGLVIHGQPVHGRMHPEGGHVPVQPLEGDAFPGYSWGEKSPFQGRRTVEGLASSVALTERLEQMTGKKNLSRSCLSELDDDHELWDHAANAIANACATLILTTSIEKIVVGGGVMKRPGLIDKVQKRTVVLLNGYLDLPRDMSSLITKSSYGDDVGLQGALVLAKQAHERAMTTGDASPSSTSVISSFSWGFVHGIVACAAIALAAFTLAKPRSSY